MGRLLQFAVPQVLEAGMGFPGRSNKGVMTVAERGLVATLRKHYRAIDLQTGS